MNAQTLAEIGGWLAVHSHSLVNGKQTQSELAGKTYWMASKCRLQRWANSLKTFENDIRQDELNHDPWPAIEIVVQEILISELLTRVFSAAMISYDFLQSSDEHVGLSHGIHIGHIEAKNRAIRILLKGQASNEEAFDRMNLLRRRMESWTDLFLAQLPVFSPANEEFAFDKNRMLDFQRENESVNLEEKSRRQHIFLVSLTSDLNSLKNHFPANPELNRQIAAGIISCFPADRFDSLGLPKSARMIWLEKAQLDTQLLLDNLEEVDYNAANQA